MGNKSVDNLLNSIEKSKENDLGRLLFGLGIRHIGKRAAQLLAEHFKSMDAIMNATNQDIQAVEEFGEKMAESLVGFMAQEQTKHTINLLKDLGINMESHFREAESDVFSGLTFVLTGTLPSYTRSEATKLIEERGGKVSGSVSKKTSYVLAGDDAGSKLDKAVRLQVKIIDEEEFKRMCGL
jgi:DNA ligase (NAD+)